MWERPRRRWRYAVSIGEDLAQARHQAGLTIAEVSHSTRIREKLIRDIEQDDYSACGGDFYARGHIRAIAHVVGADAERLIWEYDDAARRDAIATADTGPLTGLSGAAGTPGRPPAGGRIPPASTGGWPGPLGTARLPGIARPAGDGGADGTPGSFIPGGLGGHVRLPGTGRRRPMNWAVVLAVAVLAALGVVAYQ